MRRAEGRGQRAEGLGIEPWGKGFLQASLTAWPGLALVARRLSFSFSYQLSAKPGGSP